MQCPSSHTIDNLIPKNPFEESISVGYIANAFFVREMGDFRP